MKNKTVNLLLFVLAIASIAVRKNEIAKQLEISMHGAEVRRCPKCNGALVKVIYGLFVSSAYAEEIEKGIILPGGCCTGKGFPDRECMKCDYIEYQ